MPPTPKITKEMVVDAAFAVVRTQGAEKLNVRTVAEQLGCSTQPVMYHFATMEELRRAAYEKADQYHTEYLMHVGAEGEMYLLGIGLNYIRFAVDEPALFRFLFQSGYALGSGILEMVDSEALRPLLSAMGGAIGLSEAGMKEIFVSIALFAHGYASMIANNGFAFHEPTAALHLERVYRGALKVLQEETR